MDFDGVPRVVLSEFMKTHFGDKKPSTTEVATPPNSTRPNSSSSSSSIVTIVTLITGGGAAVALAMWMMKHKPTNAEDTAQHEHTTTTTTTRQRPLKIFLSALQRTQSTLGALRLALASRSWTEHVTYHATSAILYMSVLFQSHPRTWTHRTTAKDVLTDMKNRQYENAWRHVKDVWKVVRQGGNAAKAVEPANTNSVFDRVLLYRFVSMSQVILHVNALSQSNSDMFILMQSAAIGVDVLFAMRTLFKTLIQPRSFTFDSMSPKFLTESCVPGFVVNWVGGGELPTRIVFSLMRVFQVMHHTAGSHPHASPSELLQHASDIRRVSLLLSVIPTTAALSRNYQDPQTGIILRIVLFGFALADLHAFRLDEKSAEVLHVCHATFDAAVAVRGCAGLWHGGRPMGLPWQLWFMQLVVWIVILRRTPWEGIVNKWVCGGSSRPTQEATTSRPTPRGGEGIVFDGPMPPAYVPTILPKEEDETTKQ